ncbi:OLC1v1016541C1 [Oldenlandia corymbosa var. corymbosa]|uniref:OLC1v1016541C1 n=1 Tax=Oldenlandia corymbosa var. corymbosa TaxID=529605 RepID=A0AAV1E5W4_OLDCO|nr:OLC1v1016541C1 [Oldenlandia corymbosa var. corymbosa]
MPCSCLRRRRRRIQHHDEEGDKDKPIRSMAEAIFVMQQSPRSRLELDDFGACAASFQASFCGSQISHKTGHPLPLPLPLNSPDPSTRFSASSSCSSVSDNRNDNEFLSENGSFPTSRKSVESGPSSWPITSCAATRYSRSFFSSLQHPVSDRSFEFQTETSKTLSHHPTHCLPRPPVSPITFSAVEDQKWKKGKLWGEGTLGRVYAGFNSENGKMCAIKEIGIVSNPHISKILLQQLHQEQDKLSIYMECVSGGSVLKLLKEYGPFSEKIIQSYMWKILCGLAYLHDRNIAHRAIKGANILITPKGDVKLADFGMAKHLIEDSGADGLPADIWSLGCLVIEMAATKPPWSQYEVESAIFKIAHDQEIPELPNELSEEADALRSGKFLIIYAQRVALLPRPVTWDYCGLYLLRLPSFQGPQRKLRKTISFSLPDILNKATKT